MMQNIVFVIHICNLDYDYPAAGCNPHVDFLCNDKYIFFNKKEISPAYIEHFGTKNSKQRTFKRKLNSVFPTKANNFKELSDDLKRCGVTLLFRCPVDNTKVENIIQTANALKIDFSILMLTQRTSEQINYDYNLQYVDFHKQEVQANNSIIDINTYYIDCIGCVSKYNTFLKRHSIDFLKYDVDRLKADQTYYNEYRKLFNSTISHETFIENINNVLRRCGNKMKKCGYTLSTLGEMLDV